MALGLGRHHHAAANREKPLVEREYNISVCVAVLRLHCHSDTLLFVLSHVDSKYRKIARASGRGLAGHAMGGY